VNNSSNDLRSSEPAPESTSQGSSHSSQNASRSRIPARKKAQVRREAERSGEPAATTPPATARAAADQAKPTPSLDDPSLYLNRELTWLQFNRRVLHEATDSRTPPLERLKFFAIFASNLDEFFMKRIGGLKLQVATGVRELTVDGRSPQQQLDEAWALVRDIEGERDRQLPLLLEDLAAHDIRIRGYQDLSPKEKEQIRSHYLENIFPLITPQVVDPAHPFPFISNLSLNILVTIQGAPGQDPNLARVKVPVGVGVPRFLQISDHNHFIPLEEVIAHNLDLLFPEVHILAHDFFFVARNAAAERTESGANDLMELIESELRDRRIAPIVRVVVNEGMNEVRKGLLTAELGLDIHTDVFETSALMAQRNLFQLASLGNPELHDPPHHPAAHYRLQDTQRSIFYIIRESEALLLQHPFESFAQSVVRFLEEASRDPKVRAIKMTLYRTDEETRIIDLLISAAQNGKQVAVVVELKAKFDEAANIRWSERMEQSGIHVTYGVVGLKTHSKVILVVRQDFSGLRRYVHIGTGNYHGGTARIYTDIGVLTCEEDIGHDVTELFNYLTTGYTPKRNYRRILPAPKHLKKALLAKIKREIDGHSGENPGLIQMKTNALEDTDIVRALYKASVAGVRVELIVRDTCRLRPGVPGLSENISVISVVGRFLEHSRIFYFRNGGGDEYLIGSADLMTRNLERRVEVVTDVVSKPLKKELRLILDTLLDDRRNAWDMHPDGSYTLRQPESKDDIGSQMKLVEYAQARLKSKQYKKLMRAVGLRKRN
jgi:polyphosphate kinase